MTNLSDRLRRRLSRGDNHKPTGDAAENDATRGGDVTHGKSTQPPEGNTSTPPPASSHVPDAAQNFDPWGHRTLPWHGTSRLYG